MCLCAGIDEVKGINKYSAAQRAKEVVYVDPHARKRRRSSAAQEKTAGATAEQVDSVREKPQKYFEDKIDNSHEPHTPKLKRANTGAAAAAGEHPFAAEIVSLRYMPAQLTIASGEERKYQPLESIPCHWIDTEAQLKGVIKKLEAPGVLEIAIDLEAHNYRSYQGFVCLMQISTRDEDWLVDTLALRAHMQLLSPVFTDPSKVKVLHGADSDIVWLQRDFGLHIVNMFDTGQASRVLALQRFSLAFLYKQYCNVDADKQYQLADWRIRPLSEEMTRYAREDTHYLLYVYDLLRLQLLAKGMGKLQEVLDRSAKVCSRTYSKPSYDEHTHKRELAKRAERLPATSAAVFAKLHEWRDTMARKFDESLPYVLPSYVLFRIAEQIPLSEAALSDVARPLPPLVQHHAKEVVLMLQQVVAGIADPRADDKLPSSRGPSDLDELAPGQLNETESYLLSAGATPSVWKEEEEAGGDWFQKPSAKAAAPSLFGGDAQATSSAAAEETVEEVLASFESLDDMAKALLDEFTGKQDAAAEAAAVEATAEAEAEQAQTALLGAGSSMIVSTETGEEMLQAMKKPKTESTGEDDDDEEGGKQDDEPVDPTALPASIAEKFGVTSGSKRRKGKGKASRHKRRCAEAPTGASQPAAAVAEDLDETRAAVFNPLREGTVEPTYAGEKKSIRKNLSARIVPR